MPMRSQFRAKRMFIVLFSSKGLMYILKLNSGQSMTADDYCEDLSHAKAAPKGVV